MHFFTNTIMLMCIKQTYTYRSRHFFNLEHKIISQ